MKGTEKIIAHIQSDAKAKADAILAQAGQQCAEIRAAYETQAKEAYAEKIRDGVKICEEKMESRNRIALMEQKKEVLSLKQELVASAFERARKKLLSMPDADYAVFLTNLTVKAAPDGTGEVLFNAADREKYGEAVVKTANAVLNGNLKLSEETGNFSGGVVIRNGQVEVHNTVDLLIDFCRGELSSRVAAVLFE